MTATLTPAQQAGVIVQNLLSNLETDVVVAASSQLGGFFANIIKSPTQTTVVAQIALLMVTLPLSLPTLESQAITQFAQAGQQLLALLPAAV